VELLAIVTNFRTDVYRIYLKHATGSKREPFILSPRVKDYPDQTILESGF
jgi:hypothetical protein